MIGRNLRKCESVLMHCRFQWLHYGLLKSIEKYLLQNYEFHIWNNKYIYWRLILTNSIFGISYRSIYTNPQVNCSIYSIDAAAHHSIVQLFGSFAGIKKGRHGWWHMLPVVTTVTLFLPCTVYGICKAVMIYKCHWPIANVVLLPRDDGQSCAGF